MCHQGNPNPHIQGKAEEYLRLAQVKCTGLAGRTTATSNAVMCLQLAANSLKHPVDKLGSMDRERTENITLCLKLKVEKNKLIAASGVKKTIFERLCIQLEKIGSQIIVENEAVTAQPRKKQKTLLECIEQNAVSQEDAVV
ncbi:origin recognition complex subunit 6-like [Discoglossus pictus]